MVAIKHLPALKGEASICEGFLRGFKGEEEKKS
jgi:hypothetical protein